MVIIKLILIVRLKEKIITKIESNDTVKSSVIIGIVSVISLSKNINVKERKILTKVFK